MVAAVITVRKGKIRPVVFMKGEIKRSREGGVYCSGESTVDADTTKLLESM